MDGVRYYEDEDAAKFEEMKSKKHRQRRDKVYRRKRSKGIVSSEGQSGNDRSDPG